MFLTLCRPGENSSQREADYDIGEDFNAEKKLCRCVEKPFHEEKKLIEINTTTMKQFLLLPLFALVASAKHIRYINWNKDNPMFRIDNTDHIIDINKDNLLFEYDQVNLICPMAKPGTTYPEKHIIYSVSREEYESCRITNPKPKIVAVCDRPYQPKFFTITFRSFTPTPGGLEFLPGRDYYFISTSSRNDLHRRVGGGCSSHHMKMIFKVHDNSLKFEEDEQTENIQTLFREENESEVDDTKSARSDIYYYYPRDIVELENSLGAFPESKQRISRDFENEAWRREALRYTSSSSDVRKLSWSALFFTIAACLLTFLQLSSSKW